MDYSNKKIDLLLEGFRPVLGEHFDRYRHHVYRVFLNCLLIDTNAKHEETYAIAAVFHDIGIWTHHTIDYLDPSKEQAAIYLEETGREALVDEITMMIEWHHKITKYRGVYQQTVETFRKADWIDVSWGVCSFGMDQQSFRSYRRVIPTLGFHRFLAKKILLNFFKHPLRPLPMFKR